MGYGSLSGAEVKLRVPFLKENMELKKSLELEETSGIGSVGSGIPWYLFIFYFSGFMPSAGVYLLCDSQEVRSMLGSYLKKCWLNVSILSAKLPVSQSDRWRSL